MKKIRLIDSCFPQTTASIAGDNHWRGPEHFEWCRDDIEIGKEWCDGIYTWLTNWMVRGGGPHVFPKAVAWLLEPPAIQEWPYEFVAKYPQKFDAIMTYDKRLLDLGDSRVKFAPHGGSWIDWDLWGMHEKTKDVCMIVSDKNESEGHKLRHEIAKEFGERIDVYGPSYKRFDRKFDVLRDYRYCVVVESVKMDYYFSEKLIDPISVGCIPLYWGCPSIDEYFESLGIICFNDQQELRGIINNRETTSYYVDDFRARRPAIDMNIQRAKQYRMPEDWMYEHYEELFK